MIPSSQITCLLMQPSGKLYQIFGKSAGKVKKALEGLQDDKIASGTSVS